MRLLISGLGVILGLGGAAGPAPGDSTALVEAALRGPLRNTRYLSFAVRPQHEDWRHGTEGDDGEVVAGAESRSVVLCRLDLRTGRRDVVTEGESSEVDGRLGELGNGDLVRGRPPGLFRVGSRVGLSLLHGRPVPGADSWVVVAVPGGAVTREKGWLALVDPGRALDRPEDIRLLGAESGRLERVLEACSDLPSSEPPIHVEHPEFCWRYPYPLSQELFLALTDRAIWVVDAEGRAEMLYSEEELEGELASVQPDGRCAVAGPGVVAANSEMHSSRTPWRCWSCFR